MLFTIQLYRMNFNQAHVHEGVFEFYYYLQKDEKV